MKNQPVVIERTYRASAAKVWKALTDRDEMSRWYFDLAAFRPEAGFEFQFTAAKDDIKYVHLCRVTEVVAHKKISYTWKYEGYEGCSHVIFELFPEGNSTRLKLTHEGLETFPKSNPDLDSKNFVEGWTEILGTSLKNYLEKGEK